MHDFNYASLQAACKYTWIHIYASIQVCKYVRIQLSKYTSMHVYKNASMHICKYASMQGSHFIVCKAVILSLSKLSINTKIFFYKSNSVRYAIWQLLMKSEN